MDEITTSNNDAGKYATVLMQGARVVLPTLGLWGNATGYEGTFKSKRARTTSQIQKNVWLMS